MGAIGRVELDRWNWKGETGYVRPNRASASDPPAGQTDREKDDECLPDHVGQTLAKAWMKWQSREDRASCGRLTSEPRCGQGGDSMLCTFVHLILQADSDITANGPGAPQLLCPPHVSAQSRNSSFPNLYRQLNYTGGCSCRGAKVSSTSAPLIMQANAAMTANGPGAFQPFSQPHLCAQSPQCSFPSCFGHRRPRHWRHSYRSAVACASAQT